MTFFLDWRNSSLLWETHCNKRRVYWKSVWISSLHSSVFFFASLRFSCRLHCIFLWPKLCMNRLYVIVNAAYLLKRSEMGKGLLGKLGKCLDQKFVYVIHFTHKFWLFNIFKLLIRLAYVRISLYALFFPLRMLGVSGSIWLFVKCRFYCLSCNIVWNI